MFSVSFKHYSMLMFVPSSHQHRCSSHDHLPTRITGKHTILQGLTHVILLVPGLWCFSWCSYTGAWLRTPSLPANSHRLLACPTMCRAVCRGVLSFSARPQILWGQRVCHIQLCPPLHLPWAQHKEDPSNHGSVNQGASWHLLCGSRRKGRVEGGLFHWWFGHWLQS